MSEPQDSVDRDHPHVARPDAAQTRRNYVLGVASGAIGTLTFSFRHPELIIGGMIFALTGSYFLTAAVTVISKIGVLGPQLLVGGLENRPRKRPYFIGLVAARMTAALVMLAALWQYARGGSPVSLVVFFAAYLVSCCCMGAAYVVFMDMAGRMIPDGRVGTYFGTRHSLGGLLALACSVVVIHPLLNRAVLPLACRYLILLAIGTVLTAASAALFLLCREQPGAVARDRPTLAQSLRRGFGWLRTQRRYRSYFCQRVSFRVAYLGLTFFIPHGKKILAQATDAASVATLGGILVATLTLSRSLASLLWGRHADRRGYRRCMIWAGVLFLVAPALALLAMKLPPAFALPLPMTRINLDLPMLVYLLALAAMGAGLQATVVSGNRFVVVTAPEHRRISYVAFLNTVTSPLTFLPLLGAWVAGRYGTWTVFLIVAAGGLMYLAASLRMPPDDQSAAANGA